MLYQIIEEIIRDYGYSIKRIAEETGLSQKTIWLIKSKKITCARNKTTTKLITLYFTLQHQDFSQNKKSLYKFSSNSKIAFPKKNSFKHFNNHLFAIM